MYTRFTRIIHTSKYYRWITINMCLFVWLVIITSIYRSYCIVWELQDVISQSQSHDMYNYKSENKYTKTFTSNLIRNWNTSLIDLNVLFGVSIYFTMHITIYQSPFNPLKTRYWRKCATLCIQITNHTLTMLSGHIY